LPGVVLAATSVGSDEQHVKACFWVDEKSEADCPDASGVVSRRIYARIWRSVAADLVVVAIWSNIMAMSGP
jgi:hypothetical protein